MSAAFRALTLFALLFLAVPAVAQDVAPVTAAPALSASDAQNAVADIEKYLQNLRSMKARFTQTAADGATMSGDFLLKRPGRMRFDYDAPITDFIVADGRFIYYYDGQMKETANAPISQSLADFFLRSNLRLSGDVRVTDVTSENGMILLSLVQTKDPMAGTLTLGFSQAPWRLQMWRVIDTQGLATVIELSEITEGIALDDKPFHYYDPTRRERGYN